MTTQQAKKVTCEAVCRFYDVIDQSTTIGAACAKSGVSYMASSWLASFLPPRGPSAKALRQTDSAMKARVLHLFMDKKMSMEQVGRKIVHKWNGRQVGFTRERIRQILVGMGVDVRAEYEKRNLKAVSQLPKVTTCSVVKSKLMFQKRHQARFAKWRKLWADGLTLREMAEKLGTTRVYIATGIHRMRYQYGWFPYRRCEDHREGVTNGIERARLARELAALKRKKKAPRGKNITS